MAELKVDGVVHWSIPVNNLEEAEKFYGDLLGLEPKGRVGGSGMSCFKAGDHNILLCVRNDATVRTPQQDNRASSRIYGKSGNVGKRMPGISRKRREDR